MSNKAYPGVGHPHNELLGPGALYFHWGQDNEVLIGTSQGGSEFTDGAEFTRRDGDGDIMPVKGSTRLIKMTPQFKIKNLNVHRENILAWYAGMQADTIGTGTQKLYRTIDLSSSYIDYVAWVGATRNGDDIVIIIENALGDGPLEIKPEKDKEIVPEVTLTGHCDPDTFDPADKTTYPWYIQMPVSAVTFTVEDSESAAIEGATVVLDDGQTGTTDASGEASFETSYGVRGYTITKTGMTAVSSRVTVDTATEAVSVTMQSAT